MPTGAKWHKHHEGNAQPISEWISIFLHKMKSIMIKWYHVQINNVATQLTGSRGESSMIILLHGHRIN